MSAARPSVAEERWRVLGERHPPLRALVRAAAEAAGADPGSGSGSGRAPVPVPVPGPWKYATLPSRCLFFVLGLLAAGLGYVVLDLLGLPAVGLVTGLLLVGVAEALIRRRRLFASGIEESLWAAAAAMIALELLDPFLPDGRAVGPLLMAVLLGLAGWRLLNPLLTTLAAVLASLALAITAGRGWMLQEVAAAGQACFALAFFALAAGARRYRRPGHDRMLDWLVVAMPVTGYVWLLLDRAGPLTWQQLQSGSPGALLPLLFLAGFGLAALLTGLQRRTHAPLIALLACIPLLAYELRAVTGLAGHWQLMLWGASGLLAAIGLERALRAARDGITSRDDGEHDPVLELAQLGAAAVATPPSGAIAAGPAPETTVGGRGGSFSGGGASGRF